jgi:hypothetical protein
VDARRLVTEIDGRSVDPHPFDPGHLREVQAPESIGCVEEMHPLLARETRERTLVGAFASGPDFDHDDERPVARDEIDLEATKTEILREDLEAAAL